MKKIFISSLFLFLSAFSYAQEITLELFNSGFTSPLSLQHANDGRLFVVEKDGKIKVIQPTGAVNSTPFLDVSNQISNVFEQGLLGLAFHPNYESNGYFYINYTDINGNTQISRFSVSSTNADLADSNSEFPILAYNQPSVNHNGGNLAFGPDGYLYISSGDGGGGGDSNNNSQNLNSLLGKLLRIDVDNPSGGNNYGIPPNNPFIGVPGIKEEIYAYGLRNPWRFSIDFAANEIWIADVGQENIEEINRAPLANVGLNYGWRCYEGSLPFNTQGCPPASELEFPFVEYTHINGNCSITGGYVYRGSIYSDIAGLYFFADYCSGLIGTVDDSGNILEQGYFTGSWASFGEDVNKELYTVDISGGNIYKVKGSELVNTEDYIFEKSLSILPNPASENITFSLKNDTFQAIQIFDIQGSLVYLNENIDSKEVTVSVEKLNSGIYIAKIISEKGQSTIKKIMVQ